MFRITLSFLQYDYNCIIIFTEPVYSDCILIKFILIFPISSQLPINILNDFRLNEVWRISPKFLSKITANICHNVFDIEKSFPNLELQLDRSFSDIDISNYSWCTLLLVHSEWSNNNIHLLYEQDSSLTLFSITLKKGSTQ